LRKSNQSLRRAIWRRIGSKIEGEETDQANIPASISERIGISADDCEKVLAALEGVVRDGISDKLNIFKRMFSRQ
jgi:hypothetical protein